MNPRPTPLAFRRRRVLPWGLILAQVLLLAILAPLRAETMYGDFPESHVFNPPIYIFHLTGRHGESGDRTYADYYIHLDWKPAGDRMIVYGSEHSCQFLGGPFRTPGEAAGVLQPAAIAWRPLESGDQAGTALAAPPPPSPSAILLPQERPEDPYHLREEFPPPNTIQPGTTLSSRMRKLASENKWLGTALVWITLGVVFVVLRNGEYIFKTKPTVICIHCGQVNRTDRSSCTRCGRLPSR